MKAPYILQAQPDTGLPAAGQYFRIRQQREPRATWHTDPRAASTFRTLAEAERMRKALFPQIWAQIDIVPLADAITHAMARARTPELTQQVAA